MKIYQVGGAVRDRLLGKAVHDVDYVVVGGTADEMMQKGFRPVGSHFPVFLHPTTNSEYALARTERKTASGHQGFTFFAPFLRMETCFFLIVYHLMRRVCWSIGAMFFQ